MTVVSVMPSCSRVALTCLVKIVPLRVWWLELLLKNKSDRPLMTNLSNISFKSKGKGGKVFLFVYECMYGCLPVRV
jgi:hypothetical protein